MTTIRDIAKESGFSVSTVSRVLAGHPDVSRTTAAAIQEVIDRRHFSVNRNARNLKQMETTTVLVVVKGRHNVLFASMLEYVQSAVVSTGFTVVTQYIDEDANEMAEAERLIPELKPRGVVFLGGDTGNVASHARQIGEECPAVILTNSVASVVRPGVSSVTTDDRLSAKMATQYLLDRGHRAIGVIGGNPEASTISRHRQDGVMAAMAEAGVSFDVGSQYVETRYSLKCGYDAACTLLGSAPGTTAIYAMSDIMALGAIRALYDRGLTVPGDISIVGHDGIELASYMVPKLVTIRQPQELIAARGVDILMAHISGDLTPVNELVDVDVVPGESVRTLQARLAA